MIAKLENQTSTFQGPSPKVLKEFEDDASRSCEVSVGTSTFNGGS